MMTSKPVLSTNLELFVKEILELSKQGWTIEEQSPPSMYGFHYETVMVRDETVTDPPAKKTMQEIAAIGRAAKAAKKAAEAEAEATTSDETDE